MQGITVKVKINPTEEQKKELSSLSNEFIIVVNSLLKEMVQKKELIETLPNQVSPYLPDAVKLKAISKGKGLFYKAKSNAFQTNYSLKKPICSWSKNGYSITKDHLFIDMSSKKGHANRMPISILLDERVPYLDKLLKNQTNTLIIIKKGHIWMAHLSIMISKKRVNHQRKQKVMGVDLGIKVPAVAVTVDGKIRFFGNGRQAKFLRRKFKAQRKKLIQLRKKETIKSLNRKEKNWKLNQDHLISRRIVDFAIENDISIIRLEKLADIQKKKKNLSYWSYYQLSKLIEYKANLVGIVVEYVNPAYTSQICPNCNKKNKADDRLYECSCGFKKHRDIVGAMNIRYAPLIKS